MSSAEGQVQNLGYVASFPLLLNISDEPTYFMALKDSAGLVKKYAMVNIQKYQWVAIGDTVKECKKAYNALLSTNGIRTSENADDLEITRENCDLCTGSDRWKFHVYFTLREIRQYMMQI